MGKQADSVYVSGRTKSWIKLKCRRRQDFVIIGYTAPGGSRYGFGALLVGFHDAAGKLHYAGKVGTGFDETLLRSLSRRLASLKRTGPPPLGNPPREEGVTWVKPVLVAEVEFAERTEAGVLRQASFVGLREDIPPGRSATKSRKPLLEIQIRTSPRNRHQPSGALDLAQSRHHETGARALHREVGEWMLPQVANRPLTLLRCPDGAEAKCFYQRHPGSGASKKRRISLINSIPAVVSLAQCGVVEMHTWGGDAARREGTRIASPSTWIRIPSCPGKSCAPPPCSRRPPRRPEIEKLPEDHRRQGAFTWVIPILPRLAGRVRSFRACSPRCWPKARPDLFPEDGQATAHPQGVRRLPAHADTASAVAAYSPRARPADGVRPRSHGRMDKTDLRRNSRPASVPRRARTTAPRPLARLFHHPAVDYRWRWRRASARNDAVRRGRGLSVPSTSPTLREKSRGVLLEQVRRSAPRSDRRAAAPRSG